MNDSFSLRASLIALGIAFGVLIGVGFGYAASAMISYLRGSSVPEGAAFQSTDDLRRALVDRDERDEKPGGEVSLRGLVGPHPSDAIMYELLPNLNVRFKGAAVSTNSCGMRDEERTIFKPPGVYRIALLGDSFAFGWGVERERSFAVRMEQLLNKFTGGSPRVEVLNFGVPGYSTFQEVAQFEETGVDFDPDAVLVYFVDNDFGLPFFVTDFSNPGSFTLANHVGSMKKRIEGDEGAEGRLASVMNQINPNLALQRLADIGQSKGIPVFIAINPRRNWHVDLNNLWVLRQRTDIRKIPMRDELVWMVEQYGIDRNKLILSQQDPHPTELMSELLAHILVRPFLPELDAYSDMLSQ